MDTLTGAGERGELRALLILDMLPEVGPARLRMVVERFGSAEAALAAGRSAFAAVAGHRASSARTDPALRAEAERALEVADRMGMQVVTWSDPSYPARLRHLVDPPPVLFLRGRGELLHRPAVTVVGARRATAQARDVAKRIGAAVAGARVTVTSGLALGIDQSAHRGALAAGGDTVAVLGTGADVPYPRAHARLFRRIAETGLVVSEFRPGTPALPHHFPRRNRILAALGRATVVVEAGAKSGSLITVDHALDLGREVWVVPGPIERATSAGSNALLLEGARPLLSIEQLVGELTGGEQGPGGSVGRGGRAGRPDLESTQLAFPVMAGTGPGSAAAAPVVEARRAGAAAVPVVEARRAGAAAGPDALLLGALAEGALTGDDVAERTGLPVHEALRLLTTLELSGAVRRLPGMRFGLAACAGPRSDRPA